MSARPYQEPDDRTEVDDSPETTAHFELVRCKAINCGVHMICVARILALKARIEELERQQVRVYAPAPYEKGVLTVFGLGIVFGVLALLYSFIFR
jgi:hypothetical protein